MIFMGTSSLGECRFRSGSPGPRIADKSQQVGPALLQQLYFHAEINVIH